MAATNALYPAVIETYMPAFLIDSGDIEKDICKVYFSISQYNSFSDIVNAQVSVRNQNTNISVLNPLKYPCEVMLTNIYVDSSVTTDAKYYVKIQKTDIENNNFKIDEYYKVQIRFTDTEAEEISMAIPQAIDSWLVNNLDHFSEWSSVCLVRGISKPTLNLLDWDPAETRVIDWSVQNTQISGSLTFADPDENETLKSYRIRLYDTEDNLLTDSGDIYTSNYNNVNTVAYTFKYNFKVDTDYYFTFEYTTQNLYTETITYNLSMIQGNTQSYNLLLTGYIRPEDGNIDLQIRRSTDQTPISGNIVLRRSSSKENFTIWEDIHTEAVLNVQEVDITWSDFTVESGVWYSYCAQVVLPDGTRGKITEINAPIMIVLDDIYLTTAKKQLKVKFNPSLSSLKRNINETRTDTIGSKYPFIKRNGDMDYMSFPIGGLISSEMDENRKFTSKTKLYGENKKYYKDYNEQYEINRHSDVVYERAFREAVMDYLYSGEVMLFRSPTEGNYLVRLMDISLSPENTLGRRLWSFSGTAYEVDSCSIDNYDKYGIIEGRY